MAHTSNHSRTKGLAFCLSAIVMIVLARCSSGHFGELTPSSVLRTSLLSRQPGPFEAGHIAWSARREDVRSQRKGPPAGDPDLRLSTRDPGEDPDLSQEALYLLSCVQPDGQTLAVGATTALCVWNVSSGELLRTLSGHVGPVFGLAFAPDGRMLAPATKPRCVCGDAATGDLVQETPMGGYFPIAAYPSVPTVAGLR
jgi:WD40 repeat protein